jgi:hypothetical protein
MGSTNYDVTINCSFHQTIVIVSAFHSRQSGKGLTWGYYLAASPVFYTRIFRSFVHFRGSQEPIHPQGLTTWHDEGIKLWAWARVIMRI